MFQRTIAAAMRLKPDPRKLSFSKIRSRISPWPLGSARAAPYAGALCEGDTVVVWKLDRVSRSLKDVLHINQPTMSRIVAQHRMGSHKIRAIRKSGRGARDANLEEAALENSPENRDEDQRRGGVAGQARDGELPGGDRRTPR